MKKLNNLKITTNDKLAFNTEEACQLLSINRSLLDSYRQGGLIRATKMGRLYIYPKKELERFIDSNIGKEITKDGIIYGE